MATKPPELVTRRFTRYELLVKRRGEAPELLPDAYDSFDRADIAGRQLCNLGEYDDVRVVEVITVRTTYAAY